MFYDTHNSGVVVTVKVLNDQKTIVYDSAEDHVEDNGVSDQSISFFVVLERGKVESQSDLEKKATQNEN